MLRLMWGTSENCIQVTSLGEGRVEAAARQKCGRPMFSVGAGKHQLGALQRRRPSWRPTLKGSAWMASTNATRWSHTKSMSSKCPSWRPVFCRSRRGGAHQTFHLNRVWFHAQESTLLPHCQGDRLPNASRGDAQGGAPRFLDGAQMAPTFRHWPQAICLAFSGTLVTPLFPLIAKHPNPAKFPTCPQTAPMQSFMRNFFPHRASMHLSTCPRR